MIYNFRVTLAGIKGFYRVYKVDGGSSLYTFHKRLREDLEFPQDQAILFKGFDAEGGVVGKYALFDIGFGAVDHISITDTVKAGITNFLYFYDVTARKSVIITLEGESAGNVDSPVLVDSKGPVPLEFENGYVAYEDLPDEKRHLPGEKNRGGGDPDDEDLDDDDDDDENEEEDDDDETEEIYDENEDES